MERRLSRRDLARTAGSFAIVSSMSLIPLMSSERSVLAQDAPSASATAAASPFSNLGLTVLTLSVSEQGVTGLPATLAAGRYILHLEPGDMLPNDTVPGVFFAKLPDGVTMDDMAAMASTPASPTSGPPDWYYTTTLPGGVSAAPGQAGDAVIDLTAGNWFASGPQLSTPPVGLTVTGDAPTKVMDPESNATITLKDFAIDLTNGELQAGQNVIALESTGTEPHFLALSKGPDGLTRDQLAAGINADMSGTPVAGGLSESDLMPVFQSIDQSGGTKQWVVVTLEAGTYAGMCWIPDPKTGMPHAAMGMFNVFTVK